MVALLSSDEREAPPPPPRPVVALPRPRWWLRWITLASVVVLACLGLATATAALALDRVAAQILQQRHDQARRILALPDPALLANDQAFLEALQRFDGQGPRIVALRLGQETDPAAIDRTCRLAEAIVRADARLSITWAEALCDLGRTTDARILIDRIHGQHLAPNQAERLGRLAERIWLMR